MPKVDMNAVNQAIGLASTALPQLAAAYAAYRVIWGIANPSKSEADYLAHLDELSKSNITAADAILLQDGYVRDSSGGWTKLAAG